MNKVKSTALHLDTLDMFKDLLLQVSDRAMEAQEADNKKEFKKAKKEFKKLKLRYEWELNH